MHLEEDRASETDSRLSGQHGSRGPQRAAAAGSFPKHADPEREQKHAVHEEQWIDEAFRRSADGHQLADRLRGEAVPWVPQATEQVRSDVQQRRENTAQKQDLSYHAATASRLRGR